MESQRQLVCEEFNFFLIWNAYYLVSFDRIAELMGVPSSSFVDTHSEKVTDLMVKLVEYVQAMDKSQDIKST